MLLILLGVFCRVTVFLEASEMASVSGKKRKHVILTIEQKLKACEMVRNKVPKSMVMEKFNIGKSTLNDICRKEESFKKFKAQKEDLGISSVVKTAKQIKSGTFDKLDQALYIWLRQQREKGSPITGPILMEKAMEFHHLLYGESSQQFIASSGFQWRFCHRFGIRDLSISGEKLSSNTFAAEQFVKEFPDLINGYSLDQVFNCDETGLYYRMLPGRTLATVHEPPSGTKKAKERVTINACANASGSIKLPLLVIGKAKNPRCFRGVDQSTLPVVYRNQKNAWVNIPIFLDWFHNCFVPEVRAKLQNLGQEPKAILILDNCAAHPNENELVSDDGKIVAKYLPPNVTPLIQPMDQGVLVCIKRLYRKSILRDLVSQSALSIVDFLKSIDLLNVVKTVSFAWDNVSCTTLRNSWKNLIPVATPMPIPEESVTSQIDDDHFVQQFARLNIEVSSEEIQSWMCSGGPGYQHMDEQGIVDLVLDKKEEEENDELDVTVPQATRVSSAEALKGMDAYLSWYQTQPEATASSVSTLIHLREFAAEKRASSKKQPSIASFFSKLPRNEDN